MVSKETLQEWLRGFPVGTRILWNDQYKKYWLPGVVTDHKIWGTEPGRLDAAIVFRLDSEPELVKPGEDHRVHYIAKQVLKFVSK